MQGITCDETEGRIEPSVRRAAKSAADGLCARSSFGLNVRRQPVIAASDDCGPGQCSAQQLADHLARRTDAAAARMTAVRRVSATGMKSGIRSMGMAR